MTKPKAKRWKQREPLLDSPAGDELKVHDQLMNWAEWCRQKSAPRRARSAEGRYVPVSGRVFDEAPTPQIEIDPDKAAALNVAIGKLPESQRLALVYRYFRRTPHRQICRHLAIHPSAYQKFLRDSRLLLAKTISQ